MKTLLIAAGAAALMTGAAFAQDTPSATTPDATMPPAATDTTMPADTTMAPAPADTSMAPTQVAANVQTVTNGPVPDTPENRAKYGQPMSHAGKKTAPVGN